MKKAFITIFSLFCILITLSSCYSDNIYDINEMINLLNNNHGYDLNIKDFSVTQKDDYIYSNAINDSLMLIFYCNDKNEIVKCTITTTSDVDSQYHKLCRDISTIISKCNITDANEFFNKIKANPSQEINGWIFNVVENQIGMTFIINRINNDKSTNKLPTLKEKINENDISRPKSTYTFDDILP